MPPARPDDAPGGIQVGQQFRPAARFHDRRGRAAHIDIDGVRRTIAQHAARPGHDIGITADDLIHKRSVEIVRCGQRLIVLRARGDCARVEHFRIEDHVPAEAPNNAAQGGCGDLGHRGAEKWRRQRDVHSFRFSSIQYAACYLYAGFPYTCSYARQ